MRTLNEDLVHPWTESDTLLIPAGSEYWQRVADEYAAIGDGDPIHKWACIIATLMLRTHYGSPLYTKLYSALTVHLPKSVINNFLQTLPRLGYNSPNEEMLILAAQVLPRLPVAEKQYMIDAFNWMAGQCRFRSVVVQIIMNGSDSVVGRFRNILHHAPVHDVVMSKQYSRALRLQALEYILGLSGRHWEFRITPEQLDVYFDALSTNPLERAAYIGLAFPDDWKSFMDYLQQATEHDKEKATDRHGILIYDQIQRIIVAERPGPWSAAMLRDIYNNCTDCVQIVLCTAADDFIKQRIFYEDGARWVRRFTNNQTRYMCDPEYSTVQRIALWTADFEQKEIWW